MKPEIIFFPVGNGDMTLIKLESERTILIDTNIRVPSEGIPDVAADLRKSLKQDAQGRPYVDVMVLSHPDADHCRGFEEHFHTGPLDTYNDSATPKKSSSVKCGLPRWCSVARRPNISWGPMRKLGTAKRSVVSHCSKVRAAPAVMAIASL